MAQQLKNLYSKHYVALLKEAILKHFSSFDTAAFEKLIFDEQWENQALKERMSRIAQALHKSLTPSYRQNISILKAAFLEVNAAFALENMLFQEYVALFGLDDFDVSMDALAAFTINSSSEFAIREFLLRFESETLLLMQEWAKSPNEHLRRLASEGSRPRLPWAKALPSFKKDPSPILTILERLKDDESAYVRKSVANSLNDISKDNPQITKNLTKSWINHSPQRDRVLKHGCRTLLKRGDEETLELFGIKAASHVRVENFRLSDQVVMGGELNIAFELRSETPLGAIRLEYEVEFLRRDGSHFGKIFKIAERFYEEKVKDFKKKHSFEPITTRKYYVGEHRFKLIINGVVSKEAKFILRADEKL